MFTFRAVVLWIHLAAIIVWVGGMIVVPFVAAPAVRRFAGEQFAPDRAAALVETLVRRFQRLSRELFFAILLTGIFNLINAGWLTNFSYPAAWLQLVGAKFVLFLAMGVNQAWYSLALVPQGKTRIALWSALVNAALAATVLYLGLKLRFG